MTSKNSLNKTKTKKEYRTNNNKIVQQCILKNKNIVITNNIQRQIFDYWTFVLNIA